jgi:hypothetical protein
MQFGKYLLNGSLFTEADGSANGGGDNKGGTPPAIDPKVLAEALKSVIGPQLADMGKRLEVFENRFKSQDQKDAEAKAREEEERQAREDAEAAKNKSGADGGDGKGAMDAQARQLQRQLERVQKQLDDEKKLREQTETQAKQQARASKIRSALDQFEYAKPGIGKELAYKHVDPLLKTDENGELQTPDGTPLNVWLKDLFEGDLDTLAAPRSGVGGSGASGTRGSTGTVRFDINDIKPGAKNLEAIRAHISQLAREQMGQR